MSTLAWHRWQCPRCQTTHAVLFDSRITCRCGASAVIDERMPTASDDDLELLLDER